MEIFIQTYGSITAPDSAQILISHVFSKHGLPSAAQDIKISLNCFPPLNRWTDRESKSDSRTLSSDGRNPSFDSIHISQDSPAGKVSTGLQSVQQVVKEELESAIRRFKKFAHRNRSIPPDFKAGDKVWLASKNIKTTRPTKKLSERCLGPFEVIKKIGSHAYHLKLPQQWKSVHPVFHVSLSEPVKQSTIPNQHQLPPPPVLVEEQEEWEVAQVLDSKLKRGKLWYLVEWKSFSEDQKEQLGNQLPTLPTHQTLSGISIDCIQTSLPQIPQEFYFMMLGGLKRL
ncbi:hypothetical protein O181_094996 [Austropuccinia psidii MF-1]|uniref:Tf2-1-like SH3-like domain-containing protein n=1 Tax=Austropuccinia psidii MF-1 TaxID=1389203 RepID=A0A9Q3J4A1_9BASI|nr:hypothetical protein [Austropuccinia psidii MF-1]